MTSKTSDIIISYQQIQEKLQELANTISIQYKNKNLLIIGVLKGAYIIMADLTRTLWQKGLRDIEEDFVSVSSYGTTKKSNKNPILLKDTDIPIANRHILLVDDVIDTGYSLEFLVNYFGRKHPASLRTLVLVSKQTKREVNFMPDFIGFEIENTWIEGYGLDTNQRGRGNPDIITKK